MQKQCALSLHSKSYVSCIMMHELMYKMFLDKFIKKRERERGQYFFPLIYWNVKSVKILMMSGVPFRFNVLDF